MKYGQWFAFAFVTLVGSLAAQGCGSDAGSDVSYGDGGYDGAYGDDTSGDGSGGKGGGGDGSTSDATLSDSSSGSDGAGADGSSGGGDGSTSDGGTCNVFASMCTSNMDCCSGNCDLSVHLCGDPRCKVAGDSCASGNECCTFVCDPGTNTCGATQCISDNQPCTTDFSCCGGKCDSSAHTCTPLNGKCATSGNTCTANTDCCSSYCSGGFCSSTPSFCTQTGDVCSSDDECCGGACTIASGATLGTCDVVSAPGAGGCTVAGQVCSSLSDGGIGEGGVRCGGDCCSRACAPFEATGVNVCQQPSGCRPVGEICRVDDDCCGSADDPGGGKGKSFCGKGSAGAEFGRCNQGAGCQPAGTVCRLAAMECNASDNCCNANGGPDVQTHPLLCQQDIVGIPRCTQVGDCTDAGSKAGLPCSTSVDCCGLACVPTNVTDGGAPFICGARCEPKGSGCTTSADCCPGLPCVLGAGSSSGTCGGMLIDGGTGPDDAGFPPDAGSCSFFGQICGSDGDCCDDLPCVNGRCLKN